MLSTHSRAVGTCREAHYTACRCTACINPVIKQNVQGVIKVAVRVGAWGTFRGIFAERCKRYNNISSLLN
jgi:hypothetical protein